MCYDDYGDCDDSLSVTWIVVIIVAVILKIVFWSFVCYRWRRRYQYRTTSVVVVQQANHTITRPGQQHAVRAQPVAPSYASQPQPNYPGTANAPPAYAEAANKKYPSAPAAHEPPPYSDRDTAPLLP